MWGRSLTLGDDATKHLPRPAPRAPRPDRRWSMALGRSEEIMTPLKSFAAALAVAASIAGGLAGAPVAGATCCVYYNTIYQTSGRTALGQYYRDAAGGYSETSTAGNIARVAGYNGFPWARHSGIRALGNGVGTTWGDTYPWAN